MSRSAWTKDRPAAPGHFLCRFVPGYEFVVTVSVGRAGLIAEWPGRASMDVPVYVQSGFFDRAEWCASTLLTAPAPAPAEATA